MTEPIITGSPKVLLPPSEPLGEAIYVAPNLDAFTVFLDMFFVWMESTTNEPDSPTDDPSFLFKSAALVVPGDPMMDEAAACWDVVLRGYVVKDADAQITITITAGDETRVIDLPFGRHMTRPDPRGLGGEDLMWRILVPVPHRHDVAHMPPLVIQMSIGLQRRRLADRAGQDLDRFQFVSIDSIDGVIVRRARPENEGGESGKNRTAVREDAAVTVPKAKLRPQPKWLAAAAQNVVAGGSVTSSPVDDTALSGRSVPAA